MSMAVNEQQRADRPPLQQLRRQAPFQMRATGLAADGTDDGLTLDGYAAVFARETVIDSWEGRFKEEIAAGAMKKSFRESPPRVQFDHGTHPLVGSIPIAALEDGYPREEVDPELAPDGGAHVVARLHDNWLVQPVRDAIASRSIDGMSFRFSVVREQWRDADGKAVNDEQVLRDLLRRSWMEDLPDEELLVRTLKELRVPELGPVVWPAYEDTTVSVRKQLIIDLSRLHDPEQRNKLAQAVLMADRAENDEESPRPTDVDEDAPDGALETPAGEHDAPPDDTPRSTAPAHAGAAGEHESATTRGPSPVQAGVLERLRAVRASLATVRPIDERNTR